MQRYHALNDALSVPVMLGGLAGSARDWIQRHYDNDRCRLGSGPHAPNFSDYLYGPMPHNMHLPPHTDDVVPNPWTAQEIVDCCRQENIDTRSWTAAQWRALSHYYPELIECIQSTSGVLT